MNKEIAFFNVYVGAFACMIVLTVIMLLFDALVSPTLLGIDIFLLAAVAITYPRYKKVAAMIREANQK